MYNLKDRPEEMPELASLIAQLAIDHHQGGRIRMSGSDILDWFDVSCRRIMHRRFASSIYNKVRDTFEIERPRRG